MKTTGPMFSLAASGTIGGVITMATWKGRPYARIRVTPSNPRSAGQTAQRAMMRFLAQEWATLEPGTKAAWEELARAGSFSAFNAFVKQNLQSWSLFEAPSMTPGHPAVNGPGTGEAIVATPGVKSATLAVTMSAEESPWSGTIFLAVGADPTGAKSEVVRVINIDSAGNGNVELTGLTTGADYRAAVKIGSNDGQYGTLSAVVTFSPL